MKIYKNSKTNLQVIDGKIKSIADDRMSMVIATQIYDSGAKKANNIDITVNNTYALDNTFEKGKPVTAVGYPNGASSILAQTVSTENFAYEEQELAVIAGTLKFAGYNEEVNENGSKNLKADGSARKPHFDIKIDVKEGDKTVHHIIKIYDFEGQKDKNGNPQKPVIETMKNRFKDFVNAEETPMYVAIATYPGQEREWEHEVNGNTVIDYFSSHFGQKSVDIMYLFSKEKELTNTTEKTAEAETAEATIGGQDAPIVDPADEPAPAF